VSKYFRELDYQRTPLGDLTLSIRRIVALGEQEIFEIKLNDEFLMSSLFFGSEVALAQLGLKACEGDELDVVVGGLGLGFTAAAALDEPRVKSLTVVEFLEPVIKWHREGLVPLGSRLSHDPRCRFEHGDFFALAKGQPLGFDPKQAGRLFHAVLLDIDHTPEHFLNASHASLYSEAGLQQLAAQLHEKGVFAMWSDAAPEPRFTELLRRVFPRVETHVVEFPNPIQGGESRCSVYVATKD
jgi:spermidine synthase